MAQHYTQPWRLDIYRHDVVFLFPSQPITARVAIFGNGSLQRLTKCGPSLVDSTINETHKYLTKNTLKTPKTVVKLLNDEEI